MELPSYHWPRFMNVIRQTWERCWHFLKKAGTILFVCCVITWFLVSYGFDADGFGMVDVQDSLLAAIGSSLTWLFAPLGWSNWQTVAASLSGFVAKEQIVSTMGVLVNVADETGEVPELWNAVMVMFPSAAAAVSFLIFNLLDAPCLAAVSTMIKEMNSRKWAWFAFEWQMFYAWTMALMVYQLSSWVLYGTFGFWTVIALFLLAWYIWMIFRPMPEAEDRKSSAKTVKSAA